jgi:predicted nicotinamide N-methyase
VTDELTRKPVTDPTAIYRYRDGLYAQDMLIVGIVWLDLFSWLASHPSELSTILEHFGTAERPTEVMLTLFVSMGLIEQRNGSYHVTAVAREHLAADSPWFLGPYYASLKERPVCADLFKVLRTNKPANWGSQPGKMDWHRAMETREFATGFTAAMDCRGVLLAKGIAEAVDLNRRKRLLDVAGGSGIYACSLCAHFLNLRATVMEKAPVDQVAQSAISSRGFRSQVGVVAADMLMDPWPAGFDVHLLSNVLHDWDVPVVKTLLRKSFETLSPGGVLIIHDAHLNNDKSGPLHVAEYSVMLMHSTEGRCYSVKEITEYLREAGFVDAQFKPTVAGRSVIVAPKRESV